MREGDDDVSGETEAKAMMQALSNSMAVISFQPDGTILEANKNFLAAMGYTQGEIAGQHHRMFVKSEEAQGPEYTRFWRDLQSGTYKSDEFERVAKSGESVWIAASYNPILNQDGQVVKVVKFATDITERKVATVALQDALDILGRGDFGARLGPEVRGDFDSTRVIFNTTMSDLQKLFDAIIAGSQQIASVSAAVNQSSEDLASSSQAQSNDLQETTKTIRDVAEQIRATDSSAQVADEKARQAAERSRRGSEVVSGTIEAIAGIVEITKEVSDITKVIENFAFQTNLLSINAGVEAARAGDAGKGFAVVATEVRSLAQRSAEASKNIAELTRRAQIEVENGSKKATAAGEALTEIEASVASAAELIDSIAKASQRQADGVREVEGALARLDQNVSSVNGLAQDGAFQATSLGAALEKMDDLLSRFQPAGHGSERDQRMAS